MKYIFYINFSNKKCYDPAIQKYYQNAMDSNARNKFHRDICRMTTYMKYLNTNMAENDCKVAFSKYDIVKNKLFVFMHRLYF